MKPMEGTGQYHRGAGKAHKRLDQYEPIFKSPMTGTFNVQTNLNLEKSKPCIYDKGGAHKFWLVKIKDRYGWAIRWTGSKKHPTAWEVLSRIPFPEDFKTGTLEVSICEKWDPKSIAKWAAGFKWFQSFPWSPQRADSAVVWETIQKAQPEPWAGKTALDIGCNFGYHAIRAAQAGAIVTGYDKNSNVLTVARAINDHIEMQDVAFTARDPGGDFDFIFYLSVHHQKDPAYDRLAETMAALRTRARIAVFSEFILPPLRGFLTEEEVHRAIGGPLLLRYTHAVRRERSIFRTEGNGK